MSTLNSASTLAQIKAAYDDNASYAEDGSVAKAKAFVTACRLLLRRTPRRTGTREGDLELSPELIQKEMQAAQAWLDVHNTSSDSGGTGSSGPRVTRANFQNFR